MTPLLIAHRGNTQGPNPDKENHPDYIMEALNQGFEVEIDVWLIDNKFILGHDKPQYEVNQEFVFNENFWHHAKNLDVFGELNHMTPSHLINTFFHDTDDATLTSQGYIWTYPGKKIVKHSIAVMPERVPGWDISKAYGICTDFPFQYKK